ncbi:sensor histidine kinase [Alkalimarinus sediminis]|uniref:Histidine kinase n=1 Tax=Alkalimarinus sediminis TaxID=1632866 RepID=A0A9E8HI14_9ALTE|nr:histidine kinase [Alkalimarinus sediminis]UZW74710.1 histidine kinase [Alkalimarinus sediminis]
MKNSPKDKTRATSKSNYHPSQDKASFLASQHRSSGSEMVEESAAEFFLPDLCKVQSVFFLLIVTELVALLFTFAHPSTELLDWNYLGLISLFGHWTVLTSATVLCIARPTLAKLPVNLAATIAFIIIIVITILYSLIADHFLRPQSEPGVDTLFLLRNIVISAIIGGITLRYFYLQQQWKSQRQAELQARLEALQARIRPHFLFNSMNTIASLISTNPDMAEEAVLDLSELFRATLNNKQMLIPLRDELELCKRYLHIEGLRLSGRMAVDWKLSNVDGSALIPPLSLQPLVENAIYHGIQPRTEGGTITIESYRKKNTIYILISNPFDDELSDSHQKGNKIALDNIRRRFEAIFDQQAVMKTSQIDGVFTVTLRFPVHQHSK